MSFRSVSALLLSLLTIVNKVSLLTKGFPFGSLMKQQTLKMIVFNPIPAGVLENQDTLGVNLPPPSKSHVLCPNMTNDTSLEAWKNIIFEKFVF